MKRQTSISFTPDDIQFLREIACRIHSAQLPGTLFFGVGVFAYLLNFTPEYVKKRMAGQSTITGGSKEAMFSALDVARVFSEGGAE